MTARDRLDLARLRREPAHVVARLEYAVAVEEALVVVVCLLTAAAVVPHAEPIAQVVDAGGEE